MEKLVRTKYSDYMLPGTSRVASKVCIKPENEGKQVFTETMSGVASQ
jgi:hypothetical protein